MKARRVLVVTLLLAAIGFVCGGALGALVGPVVAVIRNGLVQPEPLIAIAVLGALTGGAMGAVLTPITGWLLLRHVALGRAIVHTLLGTAIGAIGGAFLPQAWWIAGALGGFVVAAVYLRIMAEPASRPAPAPPEAD